MAKKSNGAWVRRAPVYWIGGATLIALLVGIVTAAQPAGAQTMLTACAVTQAGASNNPAAKTCERTIPGTGTVSAVWKSGKTKTLASGSPSVSGRTVTFTPSDADANSDDDTGSAVYEIVVTDNGIALNRYTITVTTYAAGQAPAAPVATGPQPDVYKIEFVGDADGVVQPGKNVQLKVTRVDGENHKMRTDSISVSGLLLRAVRRTYYEDNKRDVNGNAAGGTDTHDDDWTDPKAKADVRITTIDIGQVFDSSVVVFPALQAFEGFPIFAVGDYSLDVLAQGTCFDTGGQGQRSNRCAAASKTLKEPGTSYLSLEIAVPPGTTPGVYTVTVKGYRDQVGGTAVTEMRKLTVGSPPSVGTVSFGLSSPRRAMQGETAATDGYLNDLTTREPSTIAVDDGTTELTLSVLNASNKPAEANTVSSIVLTTTGGTLSTENVNGVAQTANCKTQNSAACEIDLKSLKDSGGALQEKIRVQLKAPSVPGMATVTATVISGGTVHAPTPVQVKFSGAATSLSIGAAPGTVLGYHVGDDNADTGMDARDQISFMITSMDASGSTIKTPTVSAMVKTASGALVAQSKYQTTQSGTMMDKLMLDIDAAMASALAAGTYTLEITSGTLKTSTTFIVVGAADEVDLTLAPMQATEIGQGVTASVMATDADGNVVADGTKVVFGVSDLVGDDDAVAVLDDTSALTVAGKASTTLTVVGAGRAVVRATVSDDATPERDVEVLVSTAGMPESTTPTAEAIGLRCLSALSGFATWSCGSGATASEVFDLVSGRGASAVHLWNGSAWIRYSVVDGTMVPGSGDFTVTENDILYISGN